MEVASPLAFDPTSKKRSLACSPPLLDPTNIANRDRTEDAASLELQRSSKRRRFHADTSVESLSERFSLHSPFFTNALQQQQLQQTKSMFGAANTAASHLKRSRGEAKSPVQEDLSRVVEEQAAMIESLKTEKTKVESSLQTLKTDHDRVLKENQILRRAVTIQQDRQTQAESEIKAAQEYRVDAESRIKKLEQFILTLRYHLQVKNANHGNDFMQMPPRPPDVF